MIERRVIPAGHGAALRLKRGDHLRHSNRLMTIIADDVGRHDFLYSPCNLDMYRIQYGVTGHHANCYDNLCTAMRELQIEPEPLPTAFNFFMNVEIVGNGRLQIVPPKSRAGDSMVLRAEMDLAIALSACPAPTCNGGGATKPLAFEVLGA